jgi:hypothetical protein
MSHLGLKRSALLAGYALSALWLGSATAQEPGPPTGPAQIFQRSALDRDQRDRALADRASEEAAQAQRAETAAADAGVTPVPDQAAPHGATATAPERVPSAQEAAAAAEEAPHDHAHAMLSPPSMPTAEEAVDLPAGTIAIEVTDPKGAPYPDAQIVLGVMSSSSARTEQRATADRSGRYTFKGLATGSQQAYRVNVLYGGAKFSSTPFRLPDHTGYRARIPLKETTRNDRLFVQLVGQTVVELRDDRLHITQQARLANAGDSVFVLPQDGLIIPLPEGHTAFQWQDQMTDQKGEEIAGKGFRLRGSFPPGTVTLAWTYDVPRSGSSARIPVNLPWKTYTYRVISEAPEGLTLRASDFPEPERVKNEGRWLWFTQVQKDATSPMLAPFTVKLDGIPGPGPARWIAAIVAALLAAFGLSQALKRADDSGDRKLFIEKRKAQLMAEARAADAEHARGESGPEYLARRLSEIETELALLLRDEEALKGALKTGRAAA